MGEKKDPLAGVDWGRTFAEAVAIALKVMSEADADDVATAGVEKVIDGSAPWDPAGGKTLAGHVVAVGYNVLRNERRKVRRRMNGDFVAKVSIAIDEGLPLSPEEAAADREERARRYAKLLAASAGDPDALAVREAEREGILGSDAQMKKCGLDEAAWTNARKNIGRRLKDILAAEEKKEEAAS